MLCIKQEIGQIDKNQFALRIKYAGLLKYHKEVIDKSDRIHNDYSTIIIENYDLPEEIKKYKYRSKGNKNILKRIRNTIKGRRVNANNR